MHCTGSCTSAENSVRHVIDKSSAPELTSNWGGLLVGNMHWKRHGHYEVSYQRPSTAWGLRNLPQQRGFKLGPKPGNMSVCLTMLNK